ncbi:MAG: methyltransferase domain-containing protein [Rhodospirillaceae bacterium]|nr:methyltransferase domain-containing protein [Rhodospirillaceae bacterium]
MSKPSEEIVGWRIGLTVPEYLRAEFETLLEERAAAVSSALLDEDGEIEIAPECLWRLSVYCAGAAEGAALKALLVETATRLGLVAADIRSEAVPDEDWAAKNAQKFPLLFAGRFVVHGDHLRPPPGRIALCINAGNAFGSGMHGSTRGCLLALDAVANQRRVKHALDLGAGSGILSIAIAKCWGGGGMGVANVLAADIDPAAVAGSRAAAGDNAVVDRVRACLSDGFAVAEIGAAAPFDLICANILANPLREMAPELVRHLALDGLVILSGLLTRQEEEVTAAYQSAGLRRADQIRLGDWSTLLLTY